MFENAYTIEVVQLVAAVVGVLATLWTLWDAYKDGDSLPKDERSGPRGLLARGNVRSEIAKVLMCILFLVAGVSGTLLPPPITVVDPLPSPTKAESKAVDVVEDEATLERKASTIFRSVVTLATFIILFDSVMERRERRRYIRRIRSNGVRNDTSEKIKDVVEDAKEKLDQLIEEDEK